MKKVLITILFLLLIFMTACQDKTDKSNINNVEVDTTGDISNSNTIDYGTEPVQLREEISDTKEDRTLSMEESDYLRSLWQEAEWEPDITKTVYDYSFVFEGFNIRYTSEYGLFNDITHQRHYKITEDQRVYINSVICGLGEN